MSRIGKKAISLPQGVTVSVVNDQIDVKGPKGSLSLAIPAIVSVHSDATSITVTSNEASAKGKAFHGLIRSLIHNMVVGVDAGYRKELSIVGVGYRAAIAGNKLTLNLGFSHPIEYNVPATIKVVVADNTKITIEGCDKQLVGEVAATIRRFRKPEPYKGKGIRYADEQVRQKEGKKVG